MLDVTVDLPRVSTLRSVRALTFEEVAPLAEELATYAQHFEFLQSRAGRW